MGIKTLKNFKKGAGVNQTREEYMNFLPFSQTFRLEEKKKREPFYQEPPNKCIGMKTRQKHSRACWSRCCHSSRLPVLKSDNEVGTDLPGSLCYSVAAWKLIEVILEEKIKITGRKKLQFLRITTFISTPPPPPVLEHIRFRNLS